MKSRFFWVMNIMNMGFDCEVVSKTAEIKRKRFVPKNMAYTFSLIATLLRKPGMKAKLSIDGKEAQDVHYLLTTYANGAFCGGGFHSNPKSSLNDGKIDTILVNNVSRSRFISIVGSYKKGTHLAKKYEKQLIEQYMEKIQNVSKDDIVKIANSITINTVYFLKDNGTAKEDN